MVSDDITQAAWAIVAEHLTGGQKDPTLMVADGIRQERARWTAVQQAETAALPDGRHARLASG